VVLRSFATSELIHQVVGIIPFRSEVESPREADALDVFGNSCCCTPLLVAIHDDNDPPASEERSPGGTPSIDAGRCDRG